VGAPTLASDALAAGYEAAFREQRSHLWGILYRLTGCAADADELVQETFVRALEHPPSDFSRNLKPWLVRVATNLGRDCLRRRRRIGYVGPWLPSPIPTQEEPVSHEVVADQAMSTEGRYDLIESVSFAFLLALEALSPQQRAVLLLRDVFDYSVRQTAEALGLTDANVKTTHHRARRAMRAYDVDRRRPRAELTARTKLALERFVEALTGDDIGGLEALLAEDAREMSDGGGEYVAARRPILGRERIARYFFGIRPPRDRVVAVEMRELNGLPALDIRLPTDGGSRFASRVVVCCDVDENSRITAIYTVLASRKLSACA
jgi:RNA polymerase sigma-70 factor (ECF subfamily)